MNGVLIINKSAGLTSHDVVNRVRRILQQRSVGHLGTLDPLATGVLPLVTGSFTRLAQFYASSEKTYEGTIRFGFATDTYDADGEPIGDVQPAAISLSGLRDLARDFHGVIDQAPPPYSAKKIHGIPAYKLARKKQPVDLKPVQVEIKDFEILNVEEDIAAFRARVASGTYMRAIAHSMGQRIGCGAHLETLCRNSVAEFTLNESHSLEEVASAADHGRLQKLFAHPRTLLPELPSVTGNDEMTAKIRNGRPVNLPEFSSARLVKVFHGQRELIAIATRVAGTLFHAKIVFPGQEAVQDDPVLPEARS
ncbi:MAG: tRNA pseudouridine(55) synthase TruB [Terriglobales bacterium]